MNHLLSHVFSECPIQTKYIKLILASTGPTFVIFVTPIIII